MSPAKVELIAMQCVRCQNPVPAKPDEVVWVCAQCGQGMVLSDENGLLPQVVHYSAGIAPNAVGKPVWVAAGQATLQRQTYSGDNTRDMQEFWAQSHWFMIPAYDLPLADLAEAGVRLLQQPAALQETAAPAAFLPVTVHPEDVFPLAEYLVLALEAGRRDYLRTLNFTLQLGTPDLWIFP
jgi:predicted RNA-binding Zn-ribbon protein involved in translation (DUF1610 family)